MSDLAFQPLSGDAPVQVIRVSGLSVGSRRDPHRHDYHELIWVRSGRGRHLIDGEPLDVTSGSITVIGRGQVHLFDWAEDLHGAIVRFGDEVLFGAGTPGWLVTARGGRRVTVPPGEHGRLEAAIDALAAETGRPPDGRTSELERHLLSILLLWAERWYDAARIERPSDDDAAVQLHRRFAALLERDYARHHDAVHYADELRVPQAALSKALGEVAGRSTKELIVDRVMLEAARLLRFTDLTVGEIAHRVGYDDQLYFSRAFKRQHGEPPMAYRARAHGKSMHP